MDIDHSDDFIIEFEEDTKKNWRARFLPFQIAAS